MQIEILYNPVQSIEGAFLISTKKFLEPFQIQKGKINLKENVLFSSHLFKKVLLENEGSRPREY